MSFCKAQQRRSRPWISACKQQQCLTTSAFFSLSVARDSPPRRKLMNKLKSTRSQEIDPTAGDGVAGDGVAGDGVAQAQRPGTKPMNMSNSAMAEQIAQVAIAFE